MLGGFGKGTFRLWMLYVPVCMYIYTYTNYYTDENDSLNIQFLGVVGRTGKCHFSRMLWFSNCCTYIVVQLFRFLSIICADLNYCIPGCLPWQHKNQAIFARRYFRHIIFWLCMQDNIVNIPLVVQDVESRCFNKTFVLSTSKPSPTMQ